MRQLLLELDDLDHDALQRAIARRQSWRDEEGRPIMPDGDSNTAGAVLAEIARGWMEFCEARKP